MVDQQNPDLEALFLRVLKTKTKQQRLLCLCLAWNFLESYGDHCKKQDIL